MEGSEYAVYAADNEQEVIVAVGASYNDITVSFNGQLLECKRKASRLKLPSGAAVSHSSFA